MLIKLHISRAFDSLSWVFLFEVLRGMGFGDMFLRWIAILLFTGSFKVLVNGMLGRKIMQARGLLQGDPTSPMLFVVAMEVLTLVILRAVEANLLNPLPGTTALQRVSVYADDVVLFVKPMTQDLLAVKGILEVFGAASRLNINYSKITATLISKHASGQVCGPSVAVHLVRKN